MGHAFRFFWSNLVGDNRQTPIQLHCIAIDDLAIELPRNLYC